MPRFIRWLEEETLKVIPAIIYFWVAFSLIYFMAKLMCRPTGFSSFDYLTVIIVALVIGKILIIVDSLPFINLFPNKPLIYNIVWKSVVYNFFVFIFWSLHHLLHLYMKFHDLAIAYVYYTLGLTLPEFWACEIWLVLVFFIFVVYSEFARALGPHKIRKMLFGLQ